LETEAKNENNKYFPDPKFFPTNTKFGEYKSWSNQNHSEVRQVLQKMDDFVFFGRTRFLDAFRLFDADKDSYISTQDLIEKIKDHHLLTNKEQKVLIDFLDPEQKGFLNFKEFNKKIYANVGNSKESTGLENISTVQPSKERHEDLSSSLPSIVQTKKRLAAPFNKADTGTLSFRLFIMNLSLGSNEQKHKVREQADPQEHFQGASPFSGRARVLSRGREV
jgi:hypothetical protein